jgi:hypothetical protein
MSTTKVEKSKSDPGVLKNGVERKQITKSDTENCKRQIITPDKEDGKGQITQIDKEDGKEKKVSESKRGKGIVNVNDKLSFTD